MGRLDNDNDLNVRQAALRALGKHSPWSSKILKAVMRQFDNNGDPNIRWAAIDALGRQCHWSPKILKAVIRRLDNEKIWTVRQAIITALCGQSPWPSEVFEIVVRRLDNDKNLTVKEAALTALGTQSPWSSKTLKAVMRRLENDEDGVMASKIEALLWKNDFLSLFLNLNANATSTLCKIWAQRSIQETFACYAHGGTAYFETSDGRRSMSLSKREIKLLERILWTSIVNSPTLRLIYDRVRFPFALSQS